MKNKKLVLITVSLIIASALLLIGSMALIVSAVISEEPIPEGSAVPDTSALSGLPSDERFPNGVKQSAIDEKDGKKVATVLTEEELNLLAERRANGEWLTLSIDEMTAVIDDTIELFYNSDRIEVGGMTDGVYGVTSYNGALYYASDEFEKYTWAYTPVTFHDQTWQTAPNVKKDVMSIVLARISAYSDSIGANEIGVHIAFADMYDDSVLVASGYRPFTDYTHDYLLFEMCSGTIMLHKHSDNGNINFDSPCCKSVNLLSDSRLEKDFGDAQFVEGSRRVRVEIFEEATKELIGTFTITDRNEVNAIFDGFLESFQNACDEFKEHIASEEDASYRSAYRIVVNMESTFENVTVSYTNNMDVCYPYGYSNDVYGYIHDDRWIDYSIRGGSNFIELVDAYVGQHIPE